MTVTQDQRTAARSLVSALPWLLRSHGAVVVVKLGGHAMDAPALQARLVRDVALLRCAGIRPVVVHGGGPQITTELARRGVESVFTAGLRVTTPATMEVVRQVLVEEVNAGLVRLLEAHAPWAVGVSGEDGLLTAVRRTALVDGAAVDVGLVGDVANVDAGALRSLLDHGRVPVVATVARDAAGVLHNVNADSAASAIAVALAADRLVLVTDVAGLYADPEDPSTVLPALRVAEVETLLPGLSAGMLPKMEACARAVRGGVPSAHVVDGRADDALLLAALADVAVGTKVTL